MNPPEFQTLANPPAVRENGAAWQPRSPDLVSGELQRKTTLAVLAGAGGLGIGLLTLLLAGPTGTGEWLGLVLLGAIVSFVLVRHFEAGVVAFLSVCWIAIGTPTLAQGGSGGGGQRLLLSQAGLLVLLLMWAGRQLVKGKEARWYATPLNAPIFWYLVICIWSTLNSLIFPNEHVMAGPTKQFIQVNVLEMLIRILALGGLLMLGNTLSGKWIKAACVAALLPGLATFSGLLPFVPASHFLAFPQILTMAVLFAVVLTNYGPVWLRVLCGLFALGIFGLYFLKGTEWVSGWLGALVALSLITFVTRRKVFWVTLCAVGVVVLFNAPYFYNKVYKSNFYGSGPTRDRARVGQMGTFQNDRTRMLAASIRYADTFPLGIGLGNYRAYNQYFGRVDVWNTTVFTSAHGTYSQALSETGWLGLGTLLALVIACGRLLKRLYFALDSGWQKTFVLGTWGGSVGIFCAAFLGDYLFPTYHNGGMGSFGACVYTWLFIGLSVAISCENGIVWATLVGKNTLPLRPPVAPIYRHGPHAVALPAPGVKDNSRP